MILDEIANCHMNEYYIGEKEYAEIVNVNMAQMNINGDVDRSWKPYHALSNKQKKIPGAIGEWKDVLVVRRTY